MRLITLTCPVCSFSKQIDVVVLPARESWVTCPDCKSVFPFQAEEPKLGSETEATDQQLSEDGAAPPVPPVKQTSRTLTCSFTGNAKEYFGIWIVNTLLRIVTFGLYSPWAKVRKRRYFYGNTMLDGAPFDYLADPLAILKGLLVAGLFFGAYSFTSRISPIAALAFMLVFFGVFPWVIVRSRIFNLRNSTHRNIRFGFNADYAEAYRVFLWWQLLTPFTGGILSPYVLYRQKRFLVENSHYGTTPFRFHATAGDYFRIFIPLLVLMPLTVAAVVGVALFAGGKAALALPGVFFAGALFAVAYLAAVLYIPVAVTNLTWSSTSLGRHRFTCAIRLRDLLWIYLSNAVVVLCTLGLMAPWAAVRLVRYRLDRIKATGIGSFDEILASNDLQVGAAPEELGDMLGFDLGI
jgi:uncharacterized membrane protein YjgN (DUF898 family)